MRWTLALLVLCLPCAVHAQGLLLESTREVRVMQRAVAAENHPVRVTGVVTFCVPAALGGFVLEKDGVGIWVGLFSTDSAGRTTTWAQQNGINTPTETERQSLRVMLRQLQPGMELEVSGITVPGGYAPSIAATVMRIIAPQASLPAARPLDPNGFLTGMFDCQRVLVEGVVQERLPPQPETRSQHTQFMVAIPGHRFRFTVWSESPWSDAEIIGARLRAEALCATRFNERGETVGVFLHASDFTSWTHLEKPPQDPFDAPVIDASQLLPFRAEGPVLTRQKLVGTVTYSAPTGFLVLETGPRAVRVNRQESSGFSPGDVVEAAGFVQLQEGFAELVGANVRRISSSTPPSPETYSLSEVLTAPLNSRAYNPDDHQYRLLTLTGLYRRQEVRPDGSVQLYCETRTGDEYTALLVQADKSARHALAALRPGSEMRLTGVSELTYSSPDKGESTQMRPLSLTLLLRGMEDVHVLKQAPWWTLQRLLVAFVGTAAVLALALLWAEQLRRRVAQRSAELAQEIAERQKAQITFDAALQERKRLAADLHDGMEQTLNGLALQLQAAQRFMGESPERTTRHLDLSLNFLDSSRDELRRSLWDLRSEGLAGRSLPQALQDFMPLWVAGHETTVRLDTSGESWPIRDQIASNLIMFLREGFNNALKHAQPTTISVRLDYTRSSLTVTLQDDGKGFDCSTVPSVADGHFGLQGMRERMARIGGTMQIDSRVGGGTTLSATVQRELL
jgi:signal transduction histidine kinase